jgi:hypothetical protein
MKKGFDFGEWLSYTRIGSGGKLLFFNKLGRGMSMFGGLKRSSGECI